MKEENTTNTEENTSNTEENSFNKLMTGLSTNLVKSGALEALGASLSNTQNPGGQIFGNIYVPNVRKFTFANELQNVKNRRKQEALQEQKLDIQRAEAGMRIEDRILDRDYKNRQLGLKEKEVGAKLQEKAEKKAIGKDVTLAGINTINDLLQDIYELGGDGNYYGLGLGKKAMRGVGWLFASEKAKKAKGIQQKFKNITFDLLPNFSGAISNEERKFISDFVEDKEVEYEDVVKSLTDIALKMAKQSGIENPNIFTPPSNEDLQNSFEEID